MRKIYKETLMLLFIVLVIISPLIWKELFKESDLKTDIVKVTFNDGTKGTFRITHKKTDTLNYYLDGSDFHCRKDGVLCTGVKSFDIRIK